MIEFGRLAAAALSADGWLLMRGGPSGWELLVSHGMRQARCEQLSRAYQQAGSESAPRSPEPSITVSEQFGIPVVEIDLAGRAAAYRCSLVRSVGGAAFDDHAVRTLGRILPHFTALITMEERLRACEDAGQPKSLAAQFGLWLLERLGAEFCVVDHQLRPVLSSGLDGEAAALHVVNGRIAASTPHDDRKMRAAVSAVLDGDGGGPHVQGFSLGAESAYRPALAARFEIVDSGAARSLAALLLPRHAPPEYDPEVIRTMFGLTRVESSIVKLLCDGFVPNDAAERMRMSPNTLRHYMKVIFRKLDVHRQSELVRLVATTAGLLAKDTRDATRVLPPALSKPPVITLGRKGPCAPEPGIV